MKAILVGYGEIGKGLKGYYGKYHEIDVFDLNYQKDKYEEDYDIMLVSIPYNDEFVGYVKMYQERFKPKAIIIFSTVAIGTTVQIENAVHAPIEGKHPDLEQSIGIWEQPIGGFNEIVEEFFRIAEKSRKYHKSPEITEALKLLSTSYYGHMLEFFRYANKVLEDVGGDAFDFNSYTNNYNNLYQRMGMGNFTRPIFQKAPSGNLGGHCVVPNAKILDRQYPSDYLKEIYRDKEAN